MTTLPTTEILFFDGFDDLDAVAPFEVLTAAGFPTRAVRPPGAAKTVTTHHGLTLTIDDELSDRAELVIVPGGGWRDGTATGVRAETEGELPSRLADLHRNGAVLASVCTGAMLLAAAGVLEGRPATTHQVALDDLAAAGADVQRDGRVVDDGDVLTAGGVTAGIDLALQLVERYAGADAADLAARRLEYAQLSQRPSARDPQRAPETRA
jgi:transcriptional regulator GlxA family with amidase domain